MLADKVLNLLGNPNKMIMYFGIALAVLGQAMFLYGMINGLDKMSNGYQYFMVFVISAAVFCIIKTLMSNQKEDSIT